MGSSNNDINTSSNNNNGSSNNGINRELECLASHGERPRPPAHWAPIDSGAPRGAETEGCSMITIFYKDSGHQRQTPYTQVE